MQQRDVKVPCAGQGGGCLPLFRRRMYEEEITYLEGEIEYLSQIKHERHEHMIQKRKQEIKRIQEILNNEKRKNIQA